MKCSPARATNSSRRWPKTANTWLDERGANERDLPAGQYVSLCVTDTGLRLLESSARIDLLITDVGLPAGMNGRQVADAARALRPGLRVLFITGYAENAVIGNGRLDAGMAIMTKPFAMTALSTKIEEIMRAP